MKRVLSLNPALSPGEKTELTDLNSDHGTSALWNCFSAGVLSLLPASPMTGRGKHLQFRNLEHLSQCSGLEH